MTSDTIIAFDLYGTLLSTASIATELATHFGDKKAESIAALWRRYQLEYTFRMVSMDTYKSFDKVTASSLDHALAEAQVTLSASDKAELLKAYDSLSIFPEVESTLRSLQKDSTIYACVFSNGTDAMVNSSVKKSPSLSPLSSVFKDLITVEEVKTYKPSPKVYHHLARKVGKSNSKEDMASMWLVSGNPFDIVGARAAGMNSAWVDRAGNGWLDRLGTIVGDGPTIVVKGIDEAVKEIKNRAAKNHS
ncbi:HAD-like domain-containing protein [Calycina marina]|uniref:HAD-like domain-containing protein n=1 Tax=Calycina marina TaxID=1763456 RepID=A0A9P8CD63_9HELO|nr:HAD-like domain-containing protein [Calycina marina]